jgi:hypothetical protein
MNLDDLSKWLDSGTTACLIVLIWRVAIWMKPWAERIFTSHVQLVDTLNDTTKKQVTLQEQSVEMLTDIHRHIIPDKDNKKPHD